MGKDKRVRKKWEKRKYDKVKTSSKQIYKSELRDLEDKTVKFSGVLEVKYSDCRDEPILLTDVVVDGKVWIDHTWVKLKAADRKKIMFAKRMSRIYLEGLVDVYVSKKTALIEKYGLKNVRLVHKE